MKTSLNLAQVFPIGAVLLLPLPLCAQEVVFDTLTGASSSVDWVAKGGACLTAGDGRKGSTIPACVGLPAYSGKVQVGGVSGRLTSPDLVGEGALRLTNGDTVLDGKNGNESTGSLVSNASIATNKGVQVLFRIVTYGGNGHQTTGTDGIVFILSDASKTFIGGAAGGSLGYSCSDDGNRVEPAGVEGGYLAVGIDEFGYFSKTGTTGRTPNSVIVRGAGSIYYPALARDYPGYYPAEKDISLEDQKTATRNTCATGMLQNWSGKTITDKSGNQFLHTKTTNVPVLRYGALIAPKKFDPIKIYGDQAVPLLLRKGANYLTFALNITQNRVLSLSYTVKGGTPTQMVDKLAINGKGPLAERFRFGFTSSTGAGSNVHEILCFKAAPIPEAANSAGASVQQAAKVEAGSQVYLSYFHQLNSWGQLTASSLVADKNGKVSINSVANWDANCVLTGGACDATKGSLSAQDSSKRSILTWDGSKGVPFQFASLSAAQKKALGNAPDAGTRVAYLRGDRSNEIDSNVAGKYRRRDGILGDIVHASPAWVGPPALPYAGTGADLLQKAATSTIAEFGEPYRKFIDANKARANVV